MTIGERIAAERTKAGVSQAALAKAAGISQPTLSNLEAGLRDATWSTVQAIASALGLPAWKLVKPL